jgi:cellulose synthase (UDP-forming)
VLARGLAPDDASGYLLQRNRWAIGAMQVLRRENPLSSSGLTIANASPSRRRSLGWFDSWRTLTYIVIPLAVVATGAVPIDAPGEVFVPVFLATLAIHSFAMRSLSRGQYPPFLSILFEFIRMPAVLPATLAGLLARPGIEVQGHAQGAQRDRAVSASRCPGCCPGWSSRPAWASSGSPPRSLGSHRSRTACRGRPSAQPSSWR